MGITAAEVFQLAARFGAKKVHEQVNLVAPFVDKMKTLKIEGQTGYVTVKTGGIGTTGFLADGAPLPAGDNKKPEQLTYYPRHLFTRLDLPRGGLELVRDVKDGVRLVNEQLDTAAKDVARQLGRAVFSASLGSPAATVAAQDTIEVTDIMGFRVGMALDIFTAAGAIQCAGETADLVAGTERSKVIQSINWTPALGVYTITLTEAIDSATASVTLNATDQIFLRGAKDNALTSLDDVTSESGDVYDKGPTDIAEWSGNSLASTGVGGALTDADLRTVHDKIRLRRGEEVGAVCTNPLVLTSYMNLFTDNHRFQRGDVLDHYKLKPTFDGIAIEVDPNCPRDKAYLVNMSDVALHQFRAFGPVTDGDGRASGMGAALVSQSNFAWDIQMHLSTQLRATMRSGCGVITGIT